MFTNSRHIIHFSFTFLVSHYTTVENIIPMSIPPHTIFSPYDNIVCEYNHHKIFLFGVNDYVSPGSFVVPKNTEYGVYRILHSCGEYSDEVPRELRLSMNDNNHQILKVNIFSLAQNFSSPPNPLRQRSIFGVDEILQTQQITFLLNSDVDRMCFVFHPDTIISGEYDCVGMADCFYPVIEWMSIWSMDLML